MSAGACSPLLHDLFPGRCDAQLPSHRRASAGARRRMRQAGEFHGTQPSAVATGILFAV